MIPKIIHYCWFGGKNMPKKFEKYILKWKKLLPDYEFVLWNENNFDVYKYSFTSKAYKEKKWAFVSDFVRLYALYNYGGIYLDTDMEIIKLFDNLLTKDLILGFEEGNITTGFLASNRENIHIKKILEKHYFTLDYYGVPNTILFTNYFFQNEHINYNLNFYGENFIIYAFDYFCCNNNKTIKLTNNSCFIHHYSASWFPFFEKIKLKLKIVLFKIKILK